MLEWQKRVLDECKELDSKVKKLELFILNNPEFYHTNDYEQRRLKDQLFFMTKYSEILHSRIIHFGE